MKMEFVDEAELHQKIRLCSGGTRHCSEQCRLIF